MCCPILLYLAIRGKLLLMKLKRAVRYEVVEKDDVFLGKSHVGREVYT